MDDPATGQFRAIGASLATGGEEYDRLRPGHPNEAVDWPYRTHCFLAKSLS